MFEYLGRQVVQAPTIGVNSGRLGVRDEVEGDWWYVGHPCQAYLDNVDNNGNDCSAIADFGGRCACCNVKRMRLGLPID